jgi:hypothetical protein
LLLSIVMLMVIGIIAVQSTLNGITMEETVAQKRKGVARLKEPDLTLAPKMRGASARRSSLSARYPVNGAWPAEMRITAEKKFWRCVESGETPHLFGVEPPRPRIEAVRIVDMSSSNSWAEFAGVFRQTRAAYLDHDAAKSELKKLVPEDAKEAIGHGVRAKRSKSGAISFDLQEAEAGHAAL